MGIMRKNGRERNKNTLYNPQVYKESFIHLQIHSEKSNEAYNV